MVGFNQPKGNAGGKTRQSKTSLKDQIKKEIFNIEKDKVNKKILISGKNDTAKSSLSLALLTENLKKDESIVYIDVDHSGLEIVTDIFSEYSDQIFVYSPNPTREREKDSATVRDEEETIYMIGTIASVIQDELDAGRKIKGVIVDGISFILEYCEAFMRLEENIGVADGVSFNLWKIRNKAFRDSSSPFMLLPVPVIFVSHEDFIPEICEDPDNFANVKQRFIDECSVRILLDKIEKDNIDDYTATIVKNRSDLTTEGKSFVFLTRNLKTQDIVSTPSELSQILFPNDKKEEEKGDK